MGIYSYPLKSCRRLSDEDTDEDREKPWAVTALVVTFFVGDNHVEGRMILRERDLALKHI